MSKISTKELIICIVTIIALVLVITTDVFATTPSLNELMNDANTNSVNEIPETNNATTNNTTTNNATTNNATTNNATTNNTTSNNTTPNNAAANNANKNNTVIPDTGVDYSVVFIIAIFGVSAIYAYKKIRDYKNV